MEFGRCRKNLSCFCLGRDVRTRVVNDIALAAAGLEIVGDFCASGPSASTMVSKATLWWPVLAVTRYPAEAIAMCAARRAALYAVANRRSAETRATAASARSRAMRARKSSSSLLEVRWVWTSRLASSFVQVILGSFHEFLGASQNGGKEMVLGRHFLAELVA